MTRAELRIRELERRVGELEEQRDHARSLAVRLLSEYDQACGAWDGAPIARRCAEDEFARFGVMLSTGPKGAAS